MHTHDHKTIGIITVTLPLMVLVEIYPISLPIISLDGINGSLSVMLELNCARSVIGVEINTSKDGPLNQQQLCPSATQLRVWSQGHNDTSLTVKALAAQGQKEMICRLTFDSMTKSSHFSFLWNKFTFFYAFHVRHLLLNMLTYVISFTY